MPAFRGNAWQIGFGHQVAEGTLLNPTQMYRWVQTTSMDNDPKITEEYEADGSIDPTFVNKDSSVWKGKLTFYPRSTDVGQIIAACMGTSSETVKSAPTMSAPTASGVDGTIPAATYHTAIAALYGKTAGPLSADASIAVGSTNHIAYSGISADADATGLRVYLGPAGGASGVYTTYQDVTFGTTYNLLTIPTSASITGTETNTTAGKLHLFKPQSFLDFWTTEFGQIITGAAAPSNQIRLQIADCMFTGMTLTAEAGKPLKVEASIIGKYAKVVSALQSAVFDSGNPLIMSNATFNLDGALSVWVSKFTLKYGLTVDESIILTHVYPETFLLEKRKIEVDYDLLFQDASKYYTFLSGGVTSNPSAGTIPDAPNVATGTLDANFIAKGTDNSNALGFSVPNLVYSVKPVTPSLDGKPFMQPVSGFGLKTAAGALLTAQLRNGVTPAY